MSNAADACHIKNFYPCQQKVMAVIILNFKKSLTKPIKLKFHYADFAIKSIVNPNHKCPRTLSATTKSVDFVAESCVSRTKFR